jgi:hypothetical protein
MAMCTPMRTCTCTYIHSHNLYSEMTLPGNSPLIYILRYPHRVTYSLLFYSLLQKSLFYTKWILGKGETANETVRNIRFTLFDVCGSVHHSIIHKENPKAATVYQNFLFHICMKLNMFPATHRP